MDEFQAKLRAIDLDVKRHKIIVYMKGNKLLPRCGFSGRVVDILVTLGRPFETRDVLEDDLLRSAIKSYSDWPTLPQLYINGRFIGGSDIVSELHASGELERMVI